MGGDHTSKVLQALDGPQWGLWKPIRQLPVHLTLCSIVQPRVLPTTALHTAVLP